MQHLHSVLDDGVDLGDILLYVTLRDLEQLTLRLLHQVLYIERLIKCLSLDHRRERDQLPRQIFLGDDTGVILDMGAAGHLAGKLRDIERSAYILQFSPFLQLLRYGKHIHGTLAQRQVYDSGINLLMRFLIETLRLQDLADDRVRVFLQHQRTQHSLLQLTGLWLKTPHIGEHLHRLFPSSSCISCSFCHHSFYLGSQR